jgi:phosphomannomutase
MSTNNSNQCLRGSVICLFDVDGTITDPRQRIKTDMEEFIAKLKQKVTVGLVGGSDLVKILEQLGGEEALKNVFWFFIIFFIINI